ncbi:MAG: glycosyl hydrolase family 95 catalytic domain-containing protein [Bacteroidota bacterium]
MIYFTILFAAAALASCNEGESKLPNIIIIYADDMGYGDLNIQNPDSKIPTPNLDQLSKEGMRFMAGHRLQDQRYSEIFGTLPWAMNNLWSQYRYSMDDDMLKEKIYPLLRRSINMYLYIVEEGKDGKLHLPPTYSPETGVHKDCNIDY